MEYANLFDVRYDIEDIIRAGGDVHADKALMDAADAYGVDVDAFEKGIKESMELETVLSTYTAARINKANPDKTPITGEELMEKFRLFILGCHNRSRERCKQA